MTPTELAYFAGIFDTAGFLGVAEHKGALRPRIEIRLADRALLDKLAEAFGGKVCTYRSRDKEHFYWRRLWGSAQAVVRQVRPYLVLRTADADDILRHRCFKRGERKHQDALRRHSLWASDLRGLAA